MLKQFLNILSVIVVLLPWLSWKLEYLLFRSSRLYLFWAQTLALVPGVPGNFLRRAFYWLVFPQVSWRCEIGFGTFFSQPWGIIAEGVYIGPYCILGKTVLGKGTLIASRVSIPSGKNQHRRLSDGSLSPAEEKNFETIRVGEYVWIGEGAIVMADLGDRVTVGAGAVVTQPVPANYIVAGNPAKIIKKTLVTNTEQGHK